MEELVVNTDFAPTFAELAGVESSADGRSLVPLMGGEAIAWRSAVLLERPPAQVGGEEANSKRKGKAKTGAGDSPAFRAIRTEDYKYVEYETGRPSSTTW